MAAGQYNLTIQQGATFTKQITLKDPLGVVINLTGATVRSMIRSAYEDAAPIVSFTTSIPTPANGTFILTLSAAQTTGLSFVKALYDVEVQYSNGTVDRVLQGNVVLSKEVTK